MVEIRILTVQEERLPRYFISVQNVCLLSGTTSK